MDATVLQQLESVLHAVSSADNATRVAAEHALNDEWLARRPEEFLAGLLQFIATHADATVRSLSAILFRRMGLRAINSNSNNDDDKPVTSVWDAASPQLHEHCKSALVECLLRESERPVRKKIADTIAELAKTVTHRDLLYTDGTQGSSWPALLPALLECSRAATAEQRESAYLIFAAVPSLFATLINNGNNGDESKRPSAALLQMLAETFTRGLTDADPKTGGDVRLAALKACVAFLRSEETLQDSTTRSQFARHVMQPMAMVLVQFHSLPNRDEQALVEALSAFIDLCELLPKLVRDILPTLVPFLTAMAADREQLEDATRQTAVELLLTVAEAAPGMCRKLANFCDLVVPVVMAMMAELDDDDADWYTTTRIDDGSAGDDSTSGNSLVAEQAMDRLARSVGGKQLLPATFTLLPSMLGAADEWNKRHAALMCISAIGEGCHKYLEAEQERILDMALPHLLHDPHARVRYAACNAIGQMCTDFGPSLQHSCHAKIVPALCAAMDLTDQPRVQAHAAAALVNFCEQSEQADIVPYLDVVFVRLTKLLQTPRMYLQEQAITTLATVADTAAQLFSQYYPAVMPVLLEILSSPSTASKEYRLLRGKTMECASLIALAVGKQLFAEHAQHFIQLMVATQQAVTDTDDPQSSYLLASWARTCKVLGTDFVPYLAFVMPPLLASARHRPDFAVLDAADEDEQRDQYAEEDGWEFVRVDNQRIGIKTAALEEKCTAVEMLICYARELGAGFQPYAEEVLALVVPLLKFYFHEGVRAAAAAVIPHLFQCMKAHNEAPEKVAALWHQTCSSMLIVINDEPDAESLVQFLSSFYDAMQVMGPGSLDGARLYPLLLQAKDEPDVPVLKENLPILAYFTRAISGQISEMFQRIQARQQQRADHDTYDPEMEETLQGEEEMEDAVLGELSRVVHICFKTHATTFLPHFQQGLLPAVAGMLNNNESSSLSSSTAASGAALSMGDQARQWAVCVFDDLIEFCGAEQAWLYRAHFWEAFVHNCMNQSSADVRQAVAYGIGTLAWQLSRSPAAFDCWHNLLQDAALALDASLNAPWAKPTPRNADSDSDGDSHNIANENAVSALGKILHYVLTPLSQTGRVTEQQLQAATSMWLQRLPIVEDEEEAVHTYGYLLSLIHANNAVVVRESPLVAKILVHVLADGVLERSSATWEEYGTGRALNEQVAATARQLLHQSSAEVQAQIASSLSAVQQKRLHQLGLI